MEDVSKDVQTNWKTIVEGDSDSDSYDWKKLLKEAEEAEEEAEITKVDLFMSAINKIQEQEDEEEDEEDWSDFSDGEDVEDKIDEEEVININRNLILTYDTNVLKKYSEEINNMYMNIAFDSPIVFDVNNLKRNTTLIKLLQNHFTKKKQIGRASCRERV